ncbi:hypothetical protein FLONG3_11314, partial [Fusarium longipes]
MDIKTAHELDVVSAATGAVSGPDSLECVSRQSYSTNQHLPYTQMAGYDHSRPYRANRKMERFESRDGRSPESWNVIMDISSFPEGIEKDLHNLDMDTNWSSRLDIVTTDIIGLMREAHRVFEVSVKAENGFENMAYHYNAFNPANNVNAVLDDEPLPGLWPWPKKELDSQEEGEEQDEWKQEKEESEEFEEWFERIETRLVFSSLLLFFFNVVNMQDFLSISINGTTAAARRRAMPTTTTGAGTISRNPPA